MKKSGRKAFTLAEVLITLGIIGVVAALTIPTLINHYQKVVMSARNKKFVSSINQAVLRSTADNGPPHEWPNHILYHDPESLYDWFDEYIMGYMKILKNCRHDPIGCIAEYRWCETADRCWSANGIGNSNVLYVFNDGSMIIALTGGGLNNDTGITTGLTIHIRFDANGYSKPNVYGRDIFSYRFTVADNKFYITCDNHKNLTGGTVSTNNSRTYLIESCKTDPQTCSCLLMKDNFEFKNDYPHKL